MNQNTSAIRSFQHRLILSKDDFVRKPVKEDLIFEKLSPHLGIVFVYEDMPIQAELSQSVLPLTPEAIAVMAYEWFNQLTEAATIVKAAPNFRPH